MIWTEIDTWIVIIGALCAMACALPGCLLVLRRMSLMGDAISHTVLPGIAIAFLVTDSRDPAAMVVGAIIVGLVTAFLVQAIHVLGRVEVGAAMGIVFTTLFAIGLVLMRRAIDHVDIHPDCVLYGAVELAWFDQVSIGPIDVPRAAVVTSMALLGNVVILLLLAKEFKIAAFDPGLAASQGIRPGLMHYLLMTMTAATAVAAFETVGSILVIAMFIVPAATAWLLTDRYLHMFILAAAVAAASALLGHAGALYVPGIWGFSGTSTAGAIAVAAGVLFLAAWIASPSHGIAPQFLRRLATRIEIACEDVLALMWRLEERGGQSAMPVPVLRETLGIGPLVAGMALRRLRRSGRVTAAGSAWVLTGDGRKAASTVVRSHRLWELYLDRHFPQDRAQLHPAAERLEHVTTDEMREQLDDEAGDARHDPHGARLP